jgi:predicted acyltransferase
MEKEVSTTVHISGAVNSDLEETPLIAKPVNEKPTPVVKTRLVSLDAFRGITIWFMMLVNHSGGSWAVLNHAFWDGVTIADFVMPFFLFIVGASIALSMSKAVELKTETKWSLVKKVAWRTIKV